MTRQPNNTKHEAHGLPRSPAAPLAEVLAYRNPEVVARFLDLYPIDPADAEEIFTETKRWLWLGTQQPEGRRLPLAVSTSMFAIDEMWHTFLMFTKDYELFCERLFGNYVHHQPILQREKELAMRQAAADRETFARRNARMMERQYRFIARQLGEDTLRKWYVEFPAKYSAERLQRLHAEVLLKESSATA